MIKFRKVKLSVCCEIISGATPKTEVKEFWGGPILWATPKDLSHLEGRFISDTSKKITEKGYKSCSTQILPPYSILLSSRAPIGHVAMNTLEMCTNQGFKNLIPHPAEVLPEYLYYWLKANKNYLQGLGNGATFKEISKTIVEKIEIPLPAVEDQKHIVSQFDAADALKQKRKKAIDLIDDYIDAIFFSMFIDNADKKNIPLIKLEEITTKITDGVHFKPKYVESGIPFISVTNVTTKKLIFNNCKFISSIDHQGYIKRCKPEFDDILYTKVGATYGRACIVDTEREFSLYVSVALIKPKKNLVTSTYLKHALNSKFIKHQADKSVKGAGVPDLHLIEIKKFNIPLPAILEQEKFSEIVRKIDQIKHSMLAQSHLLEANFNALMDRVFSSKN